MHHVNYSIAHVSIETMQSQSLVMGNLPNLSSTEMSLATRLQHLQHLFGQEPPNNPGNPAGAQPPTPAKTVASNDTGQIRFNKNLLDFDYDEEDDEPDKGARESGQQPQSKQQPQQPPPPQPVQPVAPQTSSSSAETLGK